MILPMTKKRGPDQTATAISLSRELFEMMEDARKSLAINRSNFIRMCIKKEIERLRKETGK